VDVRPKTFILFQPIMIMLQLYVKCPNCDSIFPSGFQVESATQLLGFSYLCQKCLSIFSCPSTNYLQKVDGEFRKAMKKEEMFVLPTSLKRVEISGPDLFELDREVLVRDGAFLTSDRAIVVFRGEKK